MFFIVRYSVSCVLYVVMLVVMCVLCVIDAGMLFVGFIIIAYVVSCVCLSFVHCHDIMYFGMVCALAASCWYVCCYIYIMV